MLEKFVSMYKYTMPIILFYVNELEYISIEQLLTFNASLVFIQVIMANVNYGCVDDLSFRRLCSKPYFSKVNSFKYRNYHGTYRSSDN